MYNMKRDMVSPTAYRTNILILVFSAFLEHYVSLILDGVSVDQTVTQLYHTSYTTYFFFFFFFFFFFLCPLLGSVVYFAHVNPRHGHRRERVARGTGRAPHSARWPFLLTWFRLVTADPQPFLGNLPRFLQWRQTEFRNLPIMISIQNLGLFVTV